MPSSGSKMSSAPSLAASSTFKQTGILRNSRNNLKDQNFSPLLSAPPGCWRSPSMKEAIYEELMTRKTQKQKVWQERRCDLYRLLPGASPQCAACRRRRHQLARLYSFCTKKQLQLCASTLFVRFQYLRPGARTLPRASDHPQELLEKLEFRFLDFCCLP